MKLFVLAIGFLFSVASYAAEYDCRYVCGTTTGGMGSGTVCVRASDSGDAYGILTEWLEAREQGCYPASCTEVAGQPQYPNGCPWAKIN